MTKDNLDWADSHYKLVCQFTVNWVKSFNRFSEFFQRHSNILNGVEWYNTTINSDIVQLQYNSLVF